jgi:hypothetical protein
LGPEKKINISQKFPQEINFFFPEVKAGGGIETKQDLIFPLNEEHFIKI